VTQAVVGLPGPNHLHQNLARCSGKLQRCQKKAGPWPQQQYSGPSHFAPCQVKLLVRHVRVQDVKSWTFSSLDRAAHHGIDDLCSALCISYRVSPIQHRRTQQMLFLHVGQEQASLVVSDTKERDLTYEIACHMLGAQGHNISQMSQFQQKSRAKREQLEPAQSGQSMAAIL
jgi:hypothetical protein